MDSSCRHRLQLSRSAHVIDRESVPKDAQTLQHQHHPHHRVWSRGHRPSRPTRSPVTGSITGSDPTASPSQLAQPADSLTANFAPPSQGAPGLQPRAQVLTLAHVEDAQFVASLQHLFHPNPRHAHTAAHGQMAQGGQVQTDTAQAGVGHRTTAEGQTQVGQVRTAQREHFGRRVGQRTAE